MHAPRRARRRLAAIALLARRRCPGVLHLRILLLLLLLARRARTARRAPSACLGARRPFTGAQHRLLRLADDVEAADAGAAAAWGGVAGVGGGRLLGGG